ncbi:hypothetical protein AXYL_06860 (plasmid) [Achromobacter xylosoxidans A8]|uniref:Uncharacterized protein n=1 Tax=Achromobacter xylosoxidans (strain A8) TaxID=762376 RepID=E3HYI8_ACHXA|nr:hypothetical protein AXYL_06860 [Achromobacter xylosoxidans A8]
MANDRPSSAAAIPARHSMRREKHHDWQGQQEGAKLTWPTTLLRAISTPGHHPVDFNASTGAIDLMAKALLITLKPWVPQSGRRTESVLNHRM